jgi:transposase
MTRLTGTIDGVIGVDTHRDTLAAAALDPVGGVLSQTSVATDAAGYRCLLGFAVAQVPGRRCWAVEGAGSYGAGLTAFLRARGERVVEVGRPKRPPRRTGAKTDALDAVRTAREALAQEHLLVPRRRGDRQALRVLLATRHGACVAKVCAINQLKALIVGAPEELRAELRGLGTKRQVARCAALRDRPARSLEHRMTVRALRSTAHRVQLLAAEAAALRSEIDRLVAAAAPWLLELPGVGPVSAAQVLVSWSHAGRLRSEAAFAALAGVNPIPASSGQVTRHRLNRSGDRQLNRACTRSCWHGCATTQRPAPTPPGGGPRARAPGTSAGPQAGGRPAAVQAAGTLGPAWGGTGEGLVTALACALVATSCEAHSLPKRAAGTTAVAQWASCAARSGVSCCATASDRTSWNPRARPTDEAGWGSRKDNSSKLGAGRWQLGSGVLARASPVGVDATTLGWPP